jgi:hypothetical protein
MRWLFASLPWEVLGDRLVMLSLTYPGDWRPWVSDGRVWDGHRRAFAERWRRKWGPLRGVWVKEFQLSGRPHLHIYAAVPDLVPVEEFEGLRRRTLLRRRLEAQYGRYEGRRRLPAIGGDYGGDFALWLRTAWSAVVGTQGVMQRHHARGVDVAVSFWSDEEARRKDRIEVARYLVGESAKVAQKKPPEGFVHVGRYFGHLGSSAGFGPRSQELVVEAAVAAELERRLVRLVRLRLIAKRRRYGEKGAGNFDLRRAGDGVRAFDLRKQDLERVLRWAEAAAVRKASGRQVGGSGGVAPGEMTWSRDRPVSGAATGVRSRSGGEDGRGGAGSGRSVLSVEEGGGAVEDSGVHGFEVAAHGGGGVGVAEDALDVEEVEVVGAVVGGGVVEDACCGTPEVVGGDVAESGGLGPVGDDVEQGPVGGGVSPIEASGSAAAGSSEDLADDEWRLGLRIGVGGEVAGDGVAEGASCGRLAGFATFAGPGDGRQVAKIVDAEGSDLGEAHAEEAEADDDLVSEADEGPVLAGGEKLLVCLVVGEPPAGIAGLDLAIGAAVGAERAVGVAEMFGRIGGDMASSLAPAQEGDGFGGPLIDGVVGGVARGAPVDQVGFGQLGRVLASAVAEEAVEVGPGVVGGAGVGVAAAVLVQDAEEVGDLGVKRPRA